MEARIEKSRSYFETIPTTARDNPIIKTLPKCFCTLISLAIARFCTLFVLRRTVILSCAAHAHKIPRSNPKSPLLIIRVRVCSETRLSRLERVSLEVQKAQVKRTDFDFVYYTRLFDAMTALLGFSRFINYAASTCLRRVAPIAFCKQYYPGT